MFPWGKIIRRSSVSLRGGIPSEARERAFGARHDTHGKSLIILGISALCLIALSACSAAAAPTAAPINLSASNYSALGANPKPAQPTKSDIAELQAAQNGTLQQPVMVDFYSDT